jgi:hypothetical protein
LDARLSKLVQFVGRYKPPFLIPETQSAFHARALVGAHNEALSVAAMGINNPDCLPAGING